MAAPAACICSVILLLRVVAWPARKADGVLRFLQPGHFIAFGPAFVHQHAEVRVGPVSTRHRGASPRLLPPLRGDGAPDAIDVAGLASASELRRAASARGRDPGSTAAVRDFVRRPDAPSAAAIYREARWHAVHRPIAAEQRTARLWRIAKRRATEAARGIGP